MTSREDQSFCYIVQVPFLNCYQAGMWVRKDIYEVNEYDDKVSFISMKFSCLLNKSYRLLL